MPSQKSIECLVSFANLPFVVSSLSTLTGSKVGCHGTGGYQGTEAGHEECGVRPATQHETRDDLLNRDDRRMVNANSFIFLLSMPPDDDLLYELFDEGWESKAIPSWQIVYQLWNIRDECEEEGKEVGCGR